MAIKFRAGNRMRGHINDKNAFNLVVVGAIFEDEDTENIYEWNGTVWNFKEGSFASTDTKPVNAKTNSTITESDTENKYRYDGTNWKFTGRGKLASSVTKPTQAETNSIITETDTDNRYIYDGTNWAFTGRGKLASSVTKPTHAKTNSMITETDTDNTYKFDGTNWNFTGDGRMTSGQTKPSNAVSGSTILETDTLVTYDYDGSAWVARASGGAVEAGGLVLSYDTNIGNYTTPTTLVASSSSQEDNATSQEWASFNSQGYNSANPVLCSGAGPIASASPAGAPVDITIAWTFNFSRGYGWGSGGISVQHDGGETCLAQSSSTSYSTSGTSSFTGVTGVRAWGRNYTGSAGGSKYHRVIATFTSDLHTQLPISNAKDDNPSTRWMSETEDNPNVSIDMGSSTRSDHLAINYDSGDGNTETQFLVQTSDDDSTWTTQRTINFTQLSNGWNYIRFTPVSARYVRIYGTGTSKRMSIREIKVKNSISDTTLYETHGHTTISTTDTSIGLDGN